MASPAGASNNMRVGFCSLDTKRNDASGEEPHYLVAQRRGERSSTLTCRQVLDPEQKLGKADG